MKNPGTMRNGNGVIDKQWVLPEGAHVFVVMADSPAVANSSPVQFPLKRSSSLESLNLSNQRIAELLVD